MVEMQLYYKKMKLNFGLYVIEPKVMVARDYGAFLKALGEDNKTASGFDVEDKP